METGKKISFGFSKLSKKPTNINKPEEKKIDFVDCLEGQSIKLKNETEIIEKGPLVIPLRDNKKDLLDRVRDMKAKQKNKAENVEIVDNRPDSELSVDELAAREVIRDAKLRLDEKERTSEKVFVLPVKKEYEPLLEGEKEPTLNDYENIPVNDFGLAVLRGMGWKEGVGIGKNPSKTTVLKAPELRPKGLGLGASVVTKTEKPAVDTHGHSLIIKKGSYAKIVNGNQKGNYCEVQGLDEESGRIIVKTALKNKVFALNEFMLIPVTNEEYAKNSKVINNAMLEEYKELEQSKINTEVKLEQEEYNTGNGKIKNEKHTLSDRDRSEADYKSRTRNIKSEGKKYYSGDESDPAKYSRRNRKEKSKSSKHINKYSDDSSSSDSDYEKSRRTHKRKDKRRHRDKSRSPYKTKYKSSRKSSKNKHRSKSSDSESEQEHRHKHRGRDDSDDDRHRRNKR